MKAMRGAATSCIATDGAALSCAAVQREIVQRAGNLVVGTADQQRARGEMFAVGVEGLFGGLNLRALQLVDKRQQRNLPGVVHGDNRTRAIELSGQRRGIIDRLHVGLQDGRIGHAARPSR